MGDQIVTVDVIAPKKRTSKEIRKNEDGKLQSGKSSRNASSSGQISEEDEDLGASTPDKSKLDTLMARVHKEKETGKSLQNVRANNAHDQQIPNTSQVPTENQPSEPNKNDEVINEEQKISELKGQILYRHSLNRESKALIQTLFRIYNKNSSLPDAQVDASGIDGNNSSEEELKRLMTGSSHEEEEAARDEVNELTSTKSKKKKSSPTNGNQDLSSKVNLRDDSEAKDKLEASPPELENDSTADNSKKVDKTPSTTLEPKSDELVPGKDQDDNLRSISGASNYSVLLNDEEELRGDDMPPKPKWHPPWQLKQEIVAHEDAIPVLVIDPTNRWFATGSSDNMIRIWDIEDYRLKLMIKAHKQSIRSMTFGMARHRYLYSTGDDRQLLCHDVEVNRVISRYKGQSTVIYSMCMYQPSHLLVTGARDKLVKLYDTRTTKCIKQLGGHQNTVSCVLSIPNSQQVISGSHDGTLRIWDIGEGKCKDTLPGHAKSIRTMCQHPNEEKIILSASSERILAWDIDTTEIVQEIPAKDIAINSITINRLGVTVAGGSNGVMHLWDFKSGFRFQKIHRNKVYESQEIPICVFATKFDLTGTKLICSGACNVVKIYQEAFTRFRPYVDPGVIQSTSSLGNKTSCSSR